jgi:hypothetical protein
VTTKFQVVDIGHIQLQHRGCMEPDDYPVSFHKYKSFILKTKTKKGDTTI